MDEIRTFVTIARLRSFSRAAATLHRSQPAISRRVDALEQELGIPLLERRRGGVVLTDGGAALLPHAEAMLVAAQDGADAVRALARGDAGTVSLALVGSLASTTLTTTLRQFQRRHPGLRLVLQTATSQEVGELVRQGEAMLGLRYQVDPSPALVSRTVAEEPLVVVVGRDHRLADGRRHRVRELANERWVGFSARRARESFVQFLSGRLAAAGLDSPEILPIDSLTAQKRMVEAGFGVALLVESGVKEELRLGSLRRLNVPELRASLPVCVVHRRRGYLGAAARNLLERLSA